MAAAEPAQGSSGLSEATMTDDERAVRKLIDNWINASKASDLPALLSMMTDDVVFMTPRRPPFGKSQFAADSEGAPKVSVDAEAEILEIEVMGSRAFARSHLRASLTTPGAPPRRMSGYAMSVLRKEADGRWRIARDANLVMPDSG